MTDTVIDPVRVTKPLWLFYLMDYYVDIAIHL